MNILITGADGFLGAYFKNYFSNYNVIAPSRYEFDFAKTEHVAKILAHDIDVVLHCAVNGRYTPLDINDSITYNNLSMFKNFVDSKHRFKKLINIGTGAEFGLNYNISNIQENKILDVDPVESYGLSKNRISREILKLENFYTLRIFGVFDQSEPTGRLLSSLDEKLRMQLEFPVKNNRYFDYVSALDLAKVVEFYIHNNNLDKDINVVYEEKFKISDICKKYSEIKNLNSNLIKIESTSFNDYTGDGTKLKSLNLKIDGLEKSLEKYQR